MAASRVSTILQAGGKRVLEQAKPLDSDLVTENQSLSSEVARLRLRVLELERAADTDPLVPVYNRRAFMREVSRAQTVMARYDMLSSIVFFDLNGFKSINDRFGHGIGDQLLLKTGKVLLDGVRDCDMVARLGGDEFGILLFKTDASIAQAKASALACRIAEQIVELPTGNVGVTAAWGVAPCEPDDTAEQILARADRAMYMAKKSG
ncbi:MAG: GGDEF domain-containing protein [Hellea sp.]